MTSFSTAEAFEITEVDATLRRIDERDVHILDPIHVSSATSDETSGTAAGTYRARQTVVGGIYAPRNLTSAIQERFEVIKHWEGVVINVEAETFSADLRLVESSYPVADSQIEIDLDNVPEGDRSLVQKGSVFYLTVGTRYPAGGRPEKSTRLVFRRMPRWSEGDIRRSEAIAEDLWRKLNSKSQTFPDNISGNGTLKIERRE